MTHLYLILGVGLLVIGSLTAAFLALLLVVDLQWTQLELIDENVRLEHESWAMEDSIIILNAENHLLRVEIDKLKGEK